MPQVTISEAAFDFLQSRATPLVDTAATVLDKLIEELKSLKLLEKEAVLQRESFTLTSAPSVKFTTITAAKVDGKPASQKYWNNILEDVIAACVARGADMKAILPHISGQTVPGRKSDNGFRSVAAAGFSFQGLEANRALKSIAALAQAFHIGLEISFQWQDNEAAALPKQSGTIVYP